MGNPIFRCGTNAVDGVALRVGIHPGGPGRALMPEERVVAIELIDELAGILALRASDFHMNP
jgi:hypothetical protein